MTLQLDDRRLAMLKAMDIAVWLPAPAAMPAAAPEVQPRVQPEVHPDTRVHSMPVVQQGPAPGVRPSGVQGMDWPALREAVRGCTACGLCQTRKNTVFGVGAQRTDWMIVGEAPGENEDLQGEPFVGQAGKLLDNMLLALGLGRSREGAQSVFIANVLKCRPPGNRNPTPEEIAQCEPFLKGQVALVQPKVILAMGRFAVQSLLQSCEPIGKLRGRVHHYEGVPLVVTYHPAYLLRNLPDKAKAWADLCLARAALQSDTRSDA